MRNYQEWITKTLSTPDRLNTSDAAKYLGVSTRTLELWRQKKIGPKHLQIGHQVKYDINDLTAYLDSCRR